MGDESKGIAFQPQAGQPADSASQTEQEGGRPEFLTKQEAELRFKQLQSEFDRRMQGLKDSTSHRIDVRLREALAEIDRNAKRLGATPEAVAQAKNSAIMEVMTELPKEESPAPSGQQAAQPAEQEPGTKNSEAALANAGAAELEQEYGIKLEPSDPEAALLQTATSVTQWLRKYEAALQAKKQRVSTSPQARIPTSVMGGSTPSEASLLAELEQLLAHPTPANLPRIRELRAKLKR